MKNVKVKIRFDCPVCKGTGKIPAFDGWDANVNRLYSESYCPSCRGEGYLEEWRLLEELRNA